MKEIYTKDILGYSSIYQVQTGRCDDLAGWKRGDMETKMKRICIYVVYDRQNIIDNYIGCMLRELKTCMDCLVVVYNGQEILRGMKLLEEHADYLFFRENIGLDAGAFKDALCNLVGWDKVDRYDELFLINDTFFGPFCPMADIIGEMEKRDVDFWGLSKHGECRNDNMGYFPEHIQTFFLAIHSRMLHSKFFQRYWKVLPYFKTWEQVVKKHEMLFTDYFAALGFTYDVLADNDVNNSRNMGNNYTQYLSLPYELMSKRNFPILKRKPLEANILDMQTQEEFCQALEYIKNNTNYDVNLIYHHIIRTMNIADLYRNLHLVYIAPPHSVSMDTKKRIVIAVFAKYSVATNAVSEYLTKMRGPGVEIKIYTGDVGVASAYRKKGYTCITYESGEKWKEVFREVCRCDYICIICDMDLSSEEIPSCTRKSVFFNQWENLLKDYGHVKYIIKCFEEDENLGLLAPPNPIFSYYFGKNGANWKKAFKHVKHIVDELRIRCCLSLNQQPLAITDSFWIRGEILRNFIEKSNVQEEFLCFMWTYVAQDAGYYSGIVESRRYAAMNTVNQQYYLETTINKVQMQCGDFEKFEEMRKTVFYDAVQRYCRKYSDIYIYGTGYMARTYKNLLPGFLAYIVSDGQPKPDDIDGKKVIYFSELEVSSDMGIVVCLDEKNQEQVIPMLEQKGIYHSFCV